MSAPGPPLTGRSPGRRAAVFLAVLATLAGAAGGCGLRLPWDRPQAQARGDARPQGTIVIPAPNGGSSVEDAPARRPRPRPTEAAPTLAEQLGEDITEAELRVPPEPPAEGAWTFIEHGADGAVSFNACRPIPYRLRVGPGPANAEALVAEAVDRVTAATGLRFVYEGPTDVVPTSSSFPDANASLALSEAFAPVVIGWAERAETDLWASEGTDTVGVGGPRMIVFTGDEKLSVSGYALLAPDDEIKPGFGPGLTAGNVLLHELAHLVGLDHVTAGGEIMQPRLDASAPDGWGPGDRRGLWELGASRGCASSYLQVS